MNRPSDVETRLTAWLEEGPSSGPEEVLSRTFARTRSTRQDRVWLYRLTHPTRSQPMNTLFKFAVVAALALAIGIGLGPLRPSGSNVAAGPSPSPSPSPVVLPDGGSLDPGRYEIEAGPTLRSGSPSPSRRGGRPRRDSLPKEVTLTAAPANGWEGKVMFSTWILTHIYADVCKHDTLVSVGTSVDELVNALVSQKGRNVSGPTDVTVGGFPAKRIALTVPADLDIGTACGGNLHFWPDPGPNESGGLPGFVPGGTDTVYIVDVDGQRLVLVARNNPTASAQDVAELQALVDSIHIDAPTPSPSPS